MFSTTAISSNTRSALSKTSYRFLALIIFSLMIYSSFKTFNFSLENWNYRKVILSDLRNTLLAYNTNALAGQSSTQSVISKVGFIDLETLRKLQSSFLSLFAYNPDIKYYSVRGKSQFGYLEEVKKGPEGLFVIKGWAVDPLDTKQSAQAILAAKNDTVIYYIPCYLKRPDVEKALNTNVDNFGCQYFTLNEIKDVKELSFYAMSADNKSLAVLESLYIVN